MSLPLRFPFLPMEAESAKSLPAGKEWLYEPKWDGFRCLAFKEGARVRLQSKAGKELTRYFPEVVTAIQAIKTKTAIFDGELVIPIGKQFSFDELLQRIHPAASRIMRLSEDHPARYIVFDLLSGERSADYSGLPLSERRKHLEAFSSRFLRRSAFDLSPATKSLKRAERWLNAARGNIDGVVAKRLDLPYRSGERDGMKKVKRIRSADCVVGGFRYGAKRGLPGSLLLGLYDSDGLLNHVGFVAVSGKFASVELAEKVERLVEPPGFTGSAPGGPSRWSKGEEKPWKPLRPALVIEVEYDHFTGGRFRHGTRFLRWRPDKAPEQCTMKQVR